MITPDRKGQGIRPRWSAADPRTSCAVPARANACAAIGLSIAVIFTATTALAEDAFKHLKAAEIKKAIVGKIVTDGPHWADKFAPNGALESVMHGQVQKGRWSVRGSDLCLIFPNGKTNTEECFEVWRQGNQIEYRRNGAVIAQGELFNR